MLSYHERGAVVQRDHTFFSVTIPSQRLCFAPSLVSRNHDNGYSVLQAQEGTLLGSNGLVEVDLTPFFSILPLVLSLLARVT